MQIHVQNIITKSLNRKEGNMKPSVIVLWISQRQSEPSHDRFINNEKAQTDLRVRTALSEACLLTNIKYGRRWKKVKSCITGYIWQLDMLGFFANISWASTRQNLSIPQKKSIKKVMLANGRIQRGDMGSGPPPPLKHHKNIEFPSNMIWIP